MVGGEREEWARVVCHPLPSPCNVSLVPLLCLGPSLVQCEGKACGVGVIGAMERASRFPSEGGFGGGGGLEVAEGKPVGWEPTPQCWLRPQEGEGYRGLWSKMRGKQMCHADTEICPHTRPHAYPGTPRQTQGQELLDTPTWGQGKRHAATAQGSSEGWDTPMGDQPMHIPRHRVTGRCSHTQQGGVLSPTQKKSLSPACMNAEQLHTATHYKRPCHSQAHTCSHEPSHTGIIALP